MSTLRYGLVTVHTLLIVCINAGLRASAEDLTQADRDRILTALLRPTISTMDIDLFHSTTDYKATLPTEQEIRSMVDAEYTRLTLARESTRAPLNSTPDIPPINRVLIEKTIRENLANKRDRLLHKHITYSGHLYRSMINRNSSEPDWFPEVYINHGDPSRGDYLHYYINHDQKTATLRDTSNMWKRYEYAQLGQPGNYSLFAMFGDDAQEALVAAHWPLKVVESMRALADNLHFDIQKSREWEGKTVDELTIRIRDTGTPVVRMLFDSDNYARLYSETALSETGAPVYEKRYGDYRYVEGLQWDFPYYASIVAYATDGTRSSLAEIRVASATINEPIPASVFLLGDNIGRGYRITDFRYTPPIEVAMEDIDPTIGRLVDTATHPPAATALATSPAIPGAAASVTSQAATDVAGTHPQENGAAPMAEAHATFGRSLHHLGVNVLVACAALVLGLGVWLCYGRHRGTTRTGGTDGTSND